MTVTDITVRQTLSGLVELMAASGVVTATGEPAFLMGSELPAAKAPARKKSDQEVDDVRAFLDLCAPQAGAWEVVPGPCPNEPPDCIGSVEGHRYAIETAQLILPARDSRPNSVGRWALFEQVREDLFRHCGRLQPRLRQHRDYMVTLWFNPDGDNRLPPRPSGISEMIDHLELANPPSADFLSQIGSGGMPESIPGGTAMVQNSENTVGCTWGLLPDDYSSSLRSVLGFDIALAYHETYTQSILRNELKRVVEQHDDPRSELLVISVNGLTRAGMHFPSSALFASAVFDDVDPFGGWCPNHVQAVVVHDQENQRFKWLHGCAPW